MLSGADLGGRCGGMHLPISFQVLLKSFKAIKLTQKYMNKYLLK